MSFGQPPRSEQGEQPPGITSLRDVTFEHQQYALANGYSSVVELVVDELGKAVREIHGRLDTLEAQLEGSYPEEPPIDEAQIEEVP